MEELLRELSEKMERIEANQELILNKFEKVIIYPQMVASYSKPKNKKKKEEEEIEELKELLVNGSRIKARFNLAATPQPNRIRAFLKNGDPNVFDGLKRKS